MPIRPGFCTIALRDKLLEDALDVAHQVGFTAVEIWGREPHISEVYDSRRVRAARKMLRDRTLQAPVFGSYVYFGPRPANQGEVVSIESALQTAKGLGASTGRVWAGGRPALKSGKREWTQTVEGLQAACVMAGNAGMQLAVQMYDDSYADSADHLLQLIKDVDAPNLKVVWQPSWVLSKEDPYQQLQRLLPFVAHVRALNWNRFSMSPNTKPRSVALSQGVVNYRRILEVLHAGGYRGLIGVDTIPSTARDRTAALRADGQFLSQLL